jgi:tetratricopeptide (TPR) repeat protein
MAMAVELLDQAVLLMALESPERLELLPKLGGALARTGQLARADTVLNDAINRAVASGAQRLEWHARIERALWRRWSDPASERDARAIAQDALRVFEKHGDDLGLAKTWRLISDVGHPEGDASTFTESDDALERALDYARRAGDQREEADVLWWVGVAFVFGPLHAETGIRRCQEILSEAKYDGTVRAGTLGVLGVLYAMRGRFAEARDRFAQGITILKELGIKLRVVTRQHLFADIELLANNPVAVERAMRWAYEQEVEMGEKLDIPGTAHRLADALYRQNRYEEATQWIEIAGERGKGMRGLLAARRGDVELAKRLVRESVAMTERGQNLNARGTALMRLAEVLSLAGGSSEAAPVLREAIQLYERKGNLVLAQAARARLEKPGP